MSYYEKLFKIGSCESLSIAGDTKAQVKLLNTAQFQFNLQLQFVVSFIMCYILNIIISLNEIFPSYSKSFCAPLAVHAVCALLVCIVGYVNRKLTCYSGLYQVLNKSSQSACCFRITLGCDITTLVQISSDISKMHII